MPINEAMPSATIPDWSREHKTALAWSPSRSLLASLRSYQKWQAYGFWGMIPRKFAVLRHRFWSAITGCDLPINTSIGGGLLLPHPNGIVVHPMCKIGPNCLILQQVTLGTNGSQVDDGVPTLGGHVDIGAGAKILGPLTIGDHAVIGANAVVLSDVPSNAVAIGIPARIILRADRAAS
jgi:serine O-acetyltransferase